MRSKASVCCWSMPIRRARPWPGRQLVTCRRCFPVIGGAKPTLHKDMPELSRDYHVVVIDGAPRVNELGRSAIMASDMVLIPIQPSPYDVWASAEIVQLVREAQQFKENLKVAFVVNRKIANTAIGRDVANALAEFEVPVLPVALHQRVLFAESAAQGLAVFEAAPNSDAAREIAALVENIENQWRAAA